jgi:hypothetical protein
VFCYAWARSHLHSVGPRPAPATPLPRLLYCPHLHGTSSPSGMNQCDNTWSNLQIFKLTSLSLFSSQLMESLHMPKELDGLSDWVLSHWLPAGKSSHADADKKTKQWKRHGRDMTHPNEDVIHPRAYYKVGSNQPIHWFLGGKGLGIHQRTSVWVGPSQIHL